MALKFLNPFGMTSDAIQCIDYGIANGARVLNNSSGGGGYAQALYDAIDRARAAGVLFVAAARNNGSVNDILPFYPCNYQVDNVISVAAIDRRDGIATFSNYGRNKVHIGAPGVAIYSSTSGSVTQYQSFNGTSMASPHVAGVAALILAKFPGADYAEVKDRILLGAVPIPSLNGRCTTGGRLNAYNSLTLTGSGVLNVRVNPASGSFILASSTQPHRSRLSQIHRSAWWTQRSHVRRLLGAVSEARARSSSSPPVLLKVSPDLTPDDLDALVAEVRKADVAGIVATNTTLSRDGAPEYAKELVGGLSGRPLAPRSLAFLKDLVGRLEGHVPVVSVGGISSPEDAVERLEAGACLVQLYTALVYEGPRLVRSISEGISDACRRSGVAGVGALARPVAS